MNTEQERIDAAVAKALAEHLGKDTPEPPVPDELPAPSLTVAELKRRVLARSGDERQTMIRVLKLEGGLSGSLENMSPRDRYKVEQWVLGRYATYTTAKGLRVKNTGQPGTPIQMAPERIGMASAGVPQGVVVDHHKQPPKTLVGDKLKEAQQAAKRKGFEALPKGKTIPLANALPR